MQKLFLLFLATLLRLAFVPQAIAQNSPGKPKPSLTLAIVPTSYAGPVANSPMIVLNSADDRFYVLLTNTSDQPVKLFEEWNSWGYFGLSFEITYPNGQKVRSSKEERGWDKNVPTTVTIAPHGFYVFAVTMNNNPKNGAVWENSVLNYESKSDRAYISCRMRAIYSIQRDKEAIEEKAWTGTVSSPEGSYIVWP
ncbi:hypothetical protein E5K00_00475 [Hymenobacter aquaticus]|uniref:Uncharacterized protein n=1 Tax=Hymenobacter aquaticus TaxID=1867101 RepID=A0A4Z0Q4U0_9BACT|nr:hypothetical protein [Hymenobacter aquaticus]TGE23722.1 hypothetical protein E5K00_00475 [Hymenobacter aquaticus]